MNEPSKEFERLILAKLMRHGGHPIFRWMASNVAIKEDSAGNIKPIKPDRKAPFKVDGIIMAVMAIGRMMISRPRGSMYEERGVMVV